MISEAADDRGDLLQGLAGHGRQATELVFQQAIGGRQHVGCLRRRFGDEAGCGRAETAVESTDALHGLFDDGRDAGVAFAEALDQLRRAGREVLFGCTQMGDRPFRPLADRTDEGGILRPQPLGAFCRGGCDLFCRKPAGLGIGCHDGSCLLVNEARKFRRPVRQHRVEFPGPVVEHRADRVAARFERLFDRVHRHGQFLGVAGDGVADGSRALFKRRVDLGDRPGIVVFASTIVPESVELA